MGLDPRLVLSDERHHGPFLCVVCRDLTGLADALVSTAGCSHVFCQRCLEAWLGRESDSGPGGVVDMFGPPPPSRCPACNADLSYGSSSSSSKRPRSSPGSMTIAGRSVLVEPLEDAQPLAHRILRRVRVSCPLAERHGCPWEGDYGDLHSHLVSESAHRDDGGEGVAVQIGTAASTVESELETGRDEMEIDGPAVTVGTSSSETMGDSLGDAAAAMAASSRRRALATSFKEEANTKFASGDHKDASDLYGKSLSVLLPPETSAEGLDDGDRSLAAALYCNRAAARLLIRDWEGSLLDSGNAIALDPTYAKAHVRKSRALVELGRFEEAKNALEEGWGVLKGAPTMDATDSSAASAFKAVSAEMRKVQRICKLASEGQEQLREGRYAAAKATYGSLLRETTALRAMIGAARSDIGLGRADAALRLSLRIIRADGRSSEGLEIRGAALYLSGDFSQSATVLREALRLDPDDVRAKDVIRQCRLVERSVKDARLAVFRRGFDQAVGLYTEAMEASDPLPHEAPLYGLLHAERGEAYLRLKKYQEAAKDAALAIYARDDDVKAWMVKVRAYHGLGRHEEARDELGDLMRKWGAGNDIIRKAYDKADFEVRKLHRPNFYELLGVPSIASEMEIKKQYKAKALESHPDRLSGEEFTDKDRKDAEEKFKLIGEGLEILCDDFKRQLYDEGYDQEAIRERVAAAQQAAHRQGRDYHRH